MAMPRVRDEIAFAAYLATEAGRRILRHWGRPIEVDRKAHDEVVTVADREADHVIRAGLKSAFPADAIYSEEGADSSQRLSNPRVWIVDPLDGTSDFIRGGNDFSVSIGLAVQGQAVAGAVYNPVRDELFAGGLGEGVTCNGERVAASNATEVNRARITVSRKEQAALERRLPGLVLTPITSMSYKLARVAAGMDDAALSAKRRKEWGSCAGVALVHAAGGKATLLDGAPIRFNRAEPKQPLGMFASGAMLYAPLLETITELLEWIPGGLL